MLPLLLVPALALAEEAWFYLDESDARAAIAPDGTLEGVPIRRTGAVIVRSDDPTALAALPEVAWVEPLGRGDEVFRLHTRAGTDELSLARRLHGRAGVAWANPDLALPLAPTALPDDPYATEQWHLENTGQQGWTPGCDVDAPGAWTWSTGAGGLVAIIDTGVDTDHPDLAVTAGWDYVEGDADPNPDPDYDGGPHGTCAAGLAAARGDNALGVAGVAYDAGIYAIKLIGGSTTYGDVYDAFAEATDAGATVISNSWGYSDCASYHLPATLRGALDYAEEKGRGGLGAVMVFSAGNGNCDASGDGILGYHTVVGVAAVNGDDDREWYSSFGDIVDVAAPSGGVLTTDIAGAEDGYGSWDGDPDYYGWFSGTSAAAPVAAGVLTLMLQANPRLTAAQAREVLCDTALRIHPEDWDYDEAGWNPYVGCGRVDAAAAVAAVADEAPAAPAALGPLAEVYEDQVTLSWAPAEDPDGDLLRYEVRWQVGDGEPIVEETAGTSLDLTDAVAAGDAVTWQVQASDLWGPGAVGGPWSFEVLPTPKRPRHPEGCSALPRRPHVWLAALAACLLLRARKART